MFIEISKESVVEDLTVMFKALSDPTRMAVFECIRRCADDGAACGGDDGACGEGCCLPDESSTVGAVCCQMNVSNATVSHHIKELRQAGLIRTEKRGRFVCCTVNADALAAMSAYLTPGPPRGPEGEPTHGCC